MTSQGPGARREEREREGAPPPSRLGGGGFATLQASPASCSVTRSRRWRSHGVYSAWQKALRAGRVSGDPGDGAELKQKEGGRGFRRLSPSLSLCFRGSYLRLRLPHYSSGPLRKKDREHPSLGDSCVSGEMTGFVLTQLPNDA